MKKHAYNVSAPFDPPYATREERSEYAAGLRALADWVETTSFPIPSIALSTYRCNCELEIYSAWIEDEEFVKNPGSAARLIGGEVRKGESYSGGPFTLTRSFGGGVRLSYSIRREAVCEQIEVVEQVEQDVPEDDVAARSLALQIEELQEELDGLPTVTRTMDVPKTVFVCPESLLAKEPTLATVTPDECPF